MSSLPLAIHHRLPKRMPISVGFSKYTLNLNGVDAYVNAGNDVSLQATNELTIAFWVKPDTVSGDVNFLVNGGTGYSLHLLMVF